jgi:dihydrofolate synthase/folylpolyglutamate synthase
VSLGLSRVRRALAQRGHPERAFGSIVVAGTNGKGSVSASLASVLQKSGLRVGLYTSPHLHRLVERFQVNGRPIGTRAFAARVAELEPWLCDPQTPQLTFFEACTLLAFELFRDTQVDIAVLEVGLGGRLDATNVVSPVLSVITHVALDHMDRLGGTLSAIAREKAGIIKPHVPVVVAAQEPAALFAIRKVARTRRAELVDATRRPLPAGATTPLAGAFQRDNLAAVCAAVDVLRAAGFAITDRALARGLSAVRWPGRLELIQGKPSVLLDAAHNPDACMRLSEHLHGLRARYPRRVLLFGALSDKPYALMHALLRPHVQHVVVTTAGSARAASASQLAQRLGGIPVHDPIAGWRRARRLAGRNGLVVVAGSIFLMAPVRAALLGLTQDPPIAM